MENTMKVAPENDNRQHITTTLNQSSWYSTSQSGSSTNSTLVLIAVEYIKETNEYKLAPTINYHEEGACVDYVQNVSPLDPNMSSVACYSPASPECTDSDISFNNAVVVQNMLSTNGSQQVTSNNNSNTQNYVDNLTISDSTLQNISNSLSGCDTNLLKQVANGKYFLSENMSASGVLQLVSGSDAEHEVELMITDQITGISYNISTQEYLVERCLADEQQLLDALTPGNLLDNDLLDIDDVSLKSQLPDMVEPIESSETLQSQTADSRNLTNSLPSVLPAQMLIKTENYDDDCELVYNSENLRRSQRRAEVQPVENEEQLLSEVQTISDKPVESRARATLPAPYLAIVKQADDQYGVIARKMIPKCTQFGPVEGLLVVNDRAMNDNALQLLVDCGTGSIHRLDMSDENVSNWMCFVRKANSYTEQNLLVVQHGNSLFYVTTVNIMPKQELLVGYSSKYAEQYNLPLLEPIVDKNRVWHCFECDDYFQSSADLQNHLNVHDNIEKKDVRLKKKSLKKKRFKREYKKLLIECTLCLETFSFSFPNYDVLKKHLIKHQDLDCTLIKDKFSVISYNCERCGMSFESEMLLEIHNLQHKVNNNTVLSDLICPKCQKNFDTQLHLVEHVDLHCRDKTAPIVSARGFKCPVCYKIFASNERIQRHMFVHGSEESKPLKCDICDKRFLNNSALTCHLKTHTGRKHFECPMCKDSFDQVVQLKLHVAKHCVDGQYTCPHCKKVFNEYRIIRKHIRAFHCDRKHSCPHCTKPFPTLDKLRMHLLRHSDHREFLCADCGKQFKRKDKLKEHTKRMHVEERENTAPKLVKARSPAKKFTPKVLPTDYHRFIYKCHACLVGFKRRGMLVNHLAKRHPDISPDSVPELNLPILRTTRDYYCQYCDKIYKSSSKRKVHILKNHPGRALPMSNRRQGTFPEVSGLPNPTFSQTVGSVTTLPQSCQWCHKQYASKAKLLQHQRKKHADLLHSQSDETKNNFEQINMPSQNQDLTQIKRETNAFKKEIKVTANELLSEATAVLNEDRDQQYYQIISVPSSNMTMNYNNSTDLSSGYVLPSDSRLCRLLTTGNGLALHPPR